MMDTHMLITRSHYAVTVLICISLACMTPMVQAQDKVELSFSLAEETNPGHVICDVISAAHLYEHYSDSVLHTLEYFFLRQSEHFIGYFDLDAETGILTVARVIDRDVICAGVEPCVVDLDIAIRPVSYFMQIKVLITITDINDNAPRFDEDDVIVSVRENTFQGSSYRLPGVADVDSGVNGIADFRLEPEMEQFSLQVRETVPGQRDLDLLVNSRLDRESAPYYRLHVFCWDGGNPSLTGTLTIDVQVTDENDNPPRFVNATYDVTISENVDIGTSLVQVKATDSDEGQNGRIVYQFGRNTQQYHGNIFAIDENTGEITVISELDGDNEHTYSLLVEAKDAGSNSLSDFARVVIHVLDENDNAPQISINSFSASGYVEAPENELNGTFVAQILASDPDLNHNGKIDCEINNNDGNPRTLFTLKQIYEGEYQLLTAAEFNREMTSHYDVTLECRDRGEPAQITQQPIRILISDKNDNSPVFQYAQYNVTLQENNKPDKMLVKVTASDADVGDNARITYAIFNNDRGLDDGTLVSIDAHSGTVYAEVSFDREERSYYSFTVQATDNGPNPLSTTATLHLTISDANDEAPKFNVTRYRFGTYENQPIGTEIGTVRANDRDEFPNNDVSYSFIPDDQGFYNDFNIDSVKGIITTRKMLDREMVDEYHVKVKAENPGVSLSSTIDVFIHVADRNDHAPHIVFPSPTNNTVNMTSSISLNDHVTQIIAVDLDLGMNAEFVYSLVSGNENGYFVLDPAHGDIFITEMMPLMGDNLDTYELQVQVADKGNPPLYSTEKLRINISPAALTSRHVVQDGGDSRENLMIIVIASCFSFCILFIIFFLLALFLMRRRKHNQPDIRGRANSSCMEATKALLTMKGAEVTREGPECDRVRPEADRAQEQESIDSGVDTSEVIARNQNGAKVANYNAGNLYSPVTSPQYDYPPDAFKKDYTDRSPTKVHRRQEQRVFPEIRFHEAPVQNSGDSAAKTCHMREIQLRVHELYNMNNTRDTDSSASDSGKGPSEEGEAAHTSAETDMQDSHSGASVFPMVVFNPQMRSSPIQPEIPPRGSMTSLQNSSISPQKIAPHLHTKVNPNHHMLNPNKPILKKSALVVEPFNRQCLTIPDYHSENALQKKKSVHFVKPFNHTQTFQRTPQKVPITPNIKSDFRKKPNADIYANSRVHQNPDKHAEPLYARTARYEVPRTEPLPYGHPSQFPHSKLPIPVPYVSDDDDSLDGSEQDGCSSTSGSYCMDQTPHHFSEGNVDSGSYSDHILV